MAKLTQDENYYPLSVLSVDSAHHLGLLNGHINERETVKNEQNGAPTLWSAFIRSFKIPQMIVFYHC